MSAIEALAIASCTKPPGCSGQFGDVRHLILESRKGPHADRGGIGRGNDRGSHAIHVRRRKLKLESVDRMRSQLDLEFIGDRQQQRVRAGGIFEFVLAKCCPTVVSRITALEPCIKA